VEKPWLSVIVPSHNGERWLGATLQSLVDQEEQGIEVIVVDASATEASLKIVWSFADKLDIRGQRRLDLRSWTEKTNFGVEQARSDRICILHQDDLWLPNRCAKLQEWLAARSDAVMHLHPSYIIDKSGRRLGLWRCPLPSGPTPVPAPVFFERLLVQNFISIPAPTIRRDAFLRAGGLDNRLWYTADWDLYFKIAALGTVYYDPSPLTCFRIHKDSLTVLGSRNGGDFRRQHEIVVYRHAEKIAPGSRNAALRIALASIEVNCALATLISGRLDQLIKAIVSVLVLGPRGMQRYFFCSRIVDRVFPRLRALVGGSF